MSSSVDREEEPRPERTAADLLDRLLPAAEHLAFVGNIDDPDLATT